jgi:hypothetical protein
MKRPIINLKKNAGMYVLGTCLLMFGFTMTPYVKEEKKAIASENEARI